MKTLKLIMLMLVFTIATPSTTSLMAHHRLLAAIEYNNANHSYHAAYQQKIKHKTKQSKKRKGKKRYGFTGISLGSLGTGLAIGFGTFILIFVGVLLGLMILAGAITGIILAARKSRRWKKSKRMTAIKYRNQTIDNVHNSYSDFSETEIQKIIKLKLDIAKLEVQLDNMRSFRKHREYQSKLQNMKEQLHTLTANK